MIYLLTNVAKTQDVPHRTKGQGHFYEEKYSYTVIKFYNTV